MWKFEEELEHFDLSGGEHHCRDNRAQWLIVLSGGEHHSGSDPVGPGCVGVGDQDGDDQ